LALFAPFPDDRFNVIATAASRSFPVRFVDLLVDALEQWADRRPRQADGGAPPLAG
jgi:hypothetical protein